MSYKAYDCRIDRECPSCGEDMLSFDENKEELSCLACKHVEATEQ